MRFIIACLSLIVHISVQSNVNADPVHENIDRSVTREMWGALPINNPGLEQNFQPLKLVIIHHTVSLECHRFISCAEQMRTMQTWFISALGYDLPFNFLIGNEGRLYEGRGWNFEGAHTRGFNRCSLGIGFIGDYREELAGHSVVTQAQIDVVHALFEDAVRKGFLDPDFVVVGAKDIVFTESPGSNLYNALVQWEHYSHHIQPNMNCDDIYGLEEQ